MSNYHLFEITRSVMAKTAPLLPLTAGCYEFSDFDLIHIGHLLSDLNIPANKENKQEPLVDIP